MSLADAYSPYVGLVTAVDELLPSPDDARQFHVVAAPTKAAAPGSGYGAHRERARTAALGEALERYSASIVPAEDLVRARARDLPEAVEPATFSLFAREQYGRPGFPFVPFTDDTCVRWVRGVRLRDGADAWLPAQLVYLDVPRDEPLIGYATSNGLAAGPDPSSALLAALLELVERDAFMLAWNARLSFPILDWRRSPELCAYHARHFEPSLADLATIDLSAVHDVPVVVAVVRGNPGAVAVGAGAAPTVEQAWRTAATEAFAVRQAAREAALAEPERRFADDFADVRDFRDHIQLFAYARHAPRAAFLDASPERHSPADVEPLEGAEPAEQVRALVDRLAAGGIATYAVDVTSPDVADLGIRVVRAVAPLLLPLDVRHDARFLGGERLATEPVRLGFATRPLGFADLNPDPHPFP